MDSFAGTGWCVLRLRSLVVDGKVIATELDLRAHLHGGSEEARRDLQPGAHQGERRSRAPLEIRQVLHLGPEVRADAVDPLGTHLVEAPAHDTLESTQGFTEPPGELLGLLHVRHHVRVSPEIEHPIEIGCLLYTSPSPRD